MIKTQDLEHFLKESVWGVCWFKESEREYILEIVARLKAYDKLKESIELLISKCHDLSNRVYK